MVIRDSFTDSGVRDLGSKSVTDSDSDTPCKGRAPVGNAVVSVANTPQSRESQRGRARLLSKARHWMSVVKDYCRNRPKIVHVHADWTRPSDRQAALRQLDEKKIQGWRVLEGLKSGSGGFGSVACVTKDHCGKLRVRKRAHQSATDPAKSERAQKYLDDENYLLAQLNHPNIVKNAAKQEMDSYGLPGYIKTSSARDLIMSDGGHDLVALMATGERVPAKRGGRRSGHVQDPGDFPPLPAALIRKTLFQLGSALDYLHNSMHVVHGDIKPENILIKPDGHITLCDFGLAVPSCHSGRTRHHLGGTVTMMAPELIRVRMGGDESQLRGQLPALDSWSLGCTLYVVLFDRYPFPLDGSREDLGLLDAHLDREGLEDSIDRNLRRIRDTAEPGRGLSREQEKQVKTLLMGLLEYDPAQRMTIQQMMQHPFLAEAGRHSNWRKTKADRRLR